MAVAETTQPATLGEAPQSIGVRLAKAPVHLFLLLIGILWLIPAAGLFVTSLLPAATANARGWWHVFGKPSETTFENYRQIFHNSAITHALVVTAEVTIGATILPILIASLAAYALAWIEFPGRDWAFVTVVGLWSCRSRWR